MKRIFLLFFAIGIYISVSAQITITYDDLLDVGDSVDLAGVDTVPAGFGPGPAGPNQHWDFESLQPDTVYTLGFVDPATTPYGASFPGSNIASEGLVEGFGAEGFAYATKNFSVLQIDGFAGSYDIFEDIVVPFAPPEIMFDFPVNYLDSMQQSTVMDIRLGSPEPGIDSVRIKVVTSVETKVDAWGEIITPSWTGNVLRIKDFRTTIDSAWVKLFFFWVFLETNTNESISYKYLANDMGYPVLQFNTDLGGNEFSMVNYLLDESMGQQELPSVQLPAFTLYPNPASHIIYCSVQGDVPDGEMFIYDMTGRVIDRINIHQGTKVFPVDVSGYPAGIYQAVVRSKTHLIGHRKFMVR